MAYIDKVNIDGQVFNLVDTSVGDLDALETTDNSSIVAAINELVETGGGGGGGVTVYPITYNLTNVTSSNKSVSIREGKSYSTTLTVASSASLDSVKVLMEGVDVTSSAYNAQTKVISISSVTGSVTITARASLVETVAITWTRQSTATVNLSSIIDATDNDVYMTVPFVEGASQLADDKTASDNVARFTARLYSDAECTNMVGAYNISTGAIMNEEPSSTTRPFLKFNTETKVAPAGYYVILNVLNSSSAFGSNSNCTSYLNAYVKSVVLKTPEAEEETLTNAELTDIDLLRNYSLNATSLTTETVSDSTTYAGVLETAKNEWMTEYGGDINKIPLICHADQHGQMTVTNSLTMWETIDNMVSWFDISKVINFGDTTNSYQHYSNPVLGDSSLENYLRATVNVPWSKRIEMFGNHDCMSIINSTLTAIFQEQSYLNPYFKNVMARRTNNWGYHVTYDDYFNVKYVVYSMFEFANNSKTYRLSTAQWNWLIEEFSKDDGYDVVVLGHVRANHHGNLTSLISARYNKTNGTITDDDGVSHTYDFRNLKGNLLVCLHGHSHDDSYNYDQTVVAQCFDNYYDSTRPIYFVIIDRVNNQIKAWKVTNTPAYTTYTRAFTGGSDSGGSDDDDN